MDSACLRTADALGTPRGPVATALGNAPAVIVITCATEAQARAALLRDVVAVAPRSALVTRSQELRQWAKRQFPTLPVFDAAAAPWGAYRVSAPPRPPPVSHRPSEEDLRRAERALGIVWHPMGLTAIHGVADSPKAARARLAACARDAPVWALSVAFAELGEAWTASASRCRVATPDELQNTSRSSCARKGESRSCASRFVRGEHERCGCGGCAEERQALSCAEERHVQPRPTTLGG